MFERIISKKIFWGKISRRNYQENRYIWSNICAKLCTTAAFLNLEVLCAICLLDPSAETLERSGPTNHWAWSWSKLFDFIFGRTFLKNGCFEKINRRPKKHENYPDRYWRKIQRLEDLCSHKFLLVVLDNTCCCSKVHWPLEKGQGNKSDRNLVSIDLWVGTSLWCPSQEFLLPSKVYKLLSKKDYQFY